MKKIGFLAYKNIMKRPVKSIAMLLLAAVLSLSVFAGTVVTGALNNGFTSMEKRLGADIMVVPYEATTKSEFKNIVLQGSTGYFYMKGEYLDEISGMEGIGRISPQYFLATVKAGCCSIPVQIIGFDPETDFTITPWIKKADRDKLGYLDVIVGNDLNAFVGDQLSFYGVKVNVAAKLDKTGTSYDTEVFATKDTVRALTDASLDKKLNEYANINSGNVISCIMIDVADGYNADEVAGAINVHYKKLRAIRSTNMISDISDSLSNVTGVAGILAVVIWIAAFVIMIMAFVMTIAARKKEFGLMRVMGASGRKVSLIVMIEGMILSLAGSLTGIALGILVILPFSGYIETSLSLPFLLPGTGMIIMSAAGAVLLSVLAGGITAAVAAGRISRIDTGMLLRSGE